MSPAFGLAGPAAGAFLYPMMRGFGKLVRVIVDMLLFKQTGPDHDADQKSNASVAHAVAPLFPMDVFGCPGAHEGGRSVRPDVPQQTDTHRYRLGRKRPRCDVPSCRARARTRPRA